MSTIPAAGVNASLVDKTIQANTIPATTKLQVATNNLSRTVLAFPETGLGQISLLAKIGAQEQNEHDRAMELANSCTHDNRFVQLEKSLELIAATAPLAIGYHNLDQAHDGELEVLFEDEEPSPEEIINDEFEDTFKEAITEYEYPAVMSKISGALTEEERLSFKKLAVLDHNQSAVLTLAITLKRDTPKQNDLIKAVFKNLIP